MSFSTFWARLSQVNPSLSNEDSKMSLTVTSFKLQLSKAYAAGVEDAANTTKAAKDFGNVKKEKSGLDLDDLGFGDIFKGLF